MKPAEILESDLIYKSRNVEHLEIIFCTKQKSEVTYAVYYDCR